MPNPACVAYEAYRQHMNKAAVNSTYLSPWDCLTDTEKKAWWAVVKSMAELNMIPKELVAGV